MISLQSGGTPYPLQPRPHLNIPSSATNLGLVRRQNPTIDKPVILTLFQISDIHCVVCIFKPQVLRLRDTAWGHAPGFETKSTLTCQHMLIYIMYMRILDSSIQLILLGIRHFIACKCAPSYLHISAINSHISYQSSVIHAPEQFSGSMPLSGTTRVTGSADGR